MESTAASLKSTTVRKQLVERLRDAIIDSTFKPGDRLVERELCEKFNVSRASIREALRELEAQSLIDIIPHSGPVVRVIDLEEVIALWDLRHAIGTLAARRFAEKGTQADVDRFETCIRVHAQALEAADPSAIKSSKSALFESFAAGAHNPPLSRAFSQINAQLSFSWARSLHFPGRPQESVAELLTLLGAIKQRNVEAAGAAYLLYSEHVKAAGILGFKAFQENNLAAPAKTQRRQPHERDTRTAPDDGGAENLRESMQA